MTRDTQQQTDHQERLWLAYTRAVEAHQAQPSDEAARIRLIASYARFCEAFDAASAQENIQSLIWRLQQMKVAA
jgi:hypothetical protein